MWTPGIDDYTPALYSKASTLNKETEGSLKMQVITHENMVSYRTPPPYSQWQKSQNPSTSLHVLIMHCPLQRLIHTELWQEDYKWWKKECASSHGRTLQHSYQVQLQLYSSITWLLNYTLTTSVLTHMHTHDVRVGYTVVSFWYQMKAFSEQYSD